MQSELQVARWVSDLQTIRSDLTRLVHLDDVFWQVQAILQSNSDLPPSTFTTWMAQCYVCTIAAGLRRLTDRTRGTVSLYRLLDDMERLAAVVLTRHWYVESRSYLPRSLFERTFNRLSGDETVDHMPKKRVRAERERLASVTARLKRHADTLVAHRARDATRADIKFQEARTALAVAHQVANWCAAVLHDSAHARAGPTIQYDWLAIFKQPWISAGAIVPKPQSIDDLVREFDHADGV